MRSNISRHAVLSQKQSWLFSKALSQLALLLLLLLLLLQCWSAYQGGTARNQGAQGQETVRGQAGSVLMNAALTVPVPVLRIIVNTSATC
jgi:hypothetical protein